jgi:hypothetical protein
MTQKEAARLEQLLVNIDVHMGPEQADGSYAPRVLAWPDPLFAWYGAHITWESSYPFTVRYDHATPLRHTNEVHSRRGDDDVHRADASIRRDAHRAEPYKYTIALEYKDQVMIADPDTVVEPDPPPKIRE